MIKRFFKTLGESLGATACWRLAAVITYNAVVVASIYIPGPVFLHKAWMDAIQVVGPGVAAYWALTTRGVKANKRVLIARIFGLATLFNCIGEACYFWIEIVQHKDVPTPSVADAGYLLAYPFMALAVSLMNDKPMSFSRHARTFVNSLIILVAIFSVIWYYLVAPEFLNSSVPLIGRCIAAAYPICDLLVMFSYLVMLMRNDQRRPNTAYVLFGIGIASIVATDFVYTWQTLQGTYATGSLMDDGWSLGWMLTSFAATLMLRTTEGQSTTRLKEADEFLVPHRISLIKDAVWPIAMVLAFSALTYGMLVSPVHNSIKVGVEACAGILVVLVFARQFLVICENSSLLNDLSGAYLKLEEAKAQLEVNSATIQKQAHHDELTGLPNRVLFRTNCERAINHAQGSQSLTALLFLDLDRFKQINDTLGHGTGDELLRQVATRLQTITGSTCVASRMGGDEFTLVAWGLISKHEAVCLATEVLDLMHDPFLLEEQEYFLSTSLGISLCPDDAADVDSMLKHADFAMYKAKESGRAGFKLYNAETEQADEDHASLASNLRRAVEQAEFTLCYQPLVNLKTMEIDSVEALVRWNHPVRGLIPPDRFIPMAEDNGLIIPLGEWVIFEACRQAAVWAEAGYKIRVAVNVSPNQFLYPHFVGTVSRILSHSGLQSSMLRLELTEGALIRDIDQTVRVLNQLRSMGITTAADDFGTGYSSLSYVHSLPIDCVKIDRCFIKDLTAETAETSIVRTIVELANGLGHNVVAEGIETQAQLDAVMELGVGLGQGYYFSKPVPAAEVNKLFDSNHWQRKLSAA